MASSSGNISASGRPVKLSKAGESREDHLDRPAFRRSDTFTLKDGPPDELPDHIRYATYRKKMPPKPGLFVCVSQMYMVIN